MAEAPISLNIAYFPDPVKGQPLALADVYIGQPDTDPEVLANRVEVIVVQESGTRVTIAPNEQPLQTQAGGVIIYQGSPVVVRADGTVSIKVLRNGGGQAYYVPRANEILDTAITNEGVLVLNGSFEVETVPTIPDNWTLSPGTNGTVEVDTTTSSHGIKSLKFVGTDVTGGGTATSNRFNVEDSGDLDIGFTYKSTAATSLNKVEAKYYDIGGAPVATISAYSEGVANPVNFTSFVRKVTGPSGGVTAEVILTGVDGTGTIVNATTRFDDILIVPIPVETNLNDLTVGNNVVITGDIVATSGTITDIISNSITAQTTDGNLSLSGNGAGIVETDSIIASTTNGDLELTGNGSGLVIVNGLDASPRRVLLQSQTASTVASIDFINGVGGAIIDSTYDMYEIDIISAIPATNQVAFSVGITVDTGSTWETQVFLTGIGVDGLSNVVAEGGLSGRVLLPNPSTAKTHQHVLNIGTVYTRDSGNVNTNTQELNAQFVTASLATDGIQFLMQLGNIVSGTFKLYGIR